MQEYRRPYLAQICTHTRTITSPHSNIVGDAAPNNHLDSVVPATPNHSQLALSSTPSGRYCFSTTFPPPNIPFTPITCTLPLYLLRDPLGMYLPPFSDRTGPSGGVTGGVISFIIPNPQFPCAPPLTCGRCRSVKLELRRRGGSSYSVAEVAERGGIVEKGVGVGGAESLISDVSRGRRCFSLNSILWTFRSPLATSIFARSYMYNPTNVMTILPRQPQITLRVGTLMLERALFVVQTK